MFLCFTVFTGMVTVRAGFITPLSHPITGLAVLVTLTLVLYIIYVTMVTILYQLNLLNNLSSSEVYIFSIYLEHEV